MEDNSNNPRNSQSSLFKRLTRLFSGPIVTRRRRQIQSQRAEAPDKYTFRTNTGREFKKKEYYNPFQPMQLKNLATMDRVSRYADFEEMEYTPEIASALDVYADEPTEDFWKLDKKQRKSNLQFNKVHYAQGTKGIATLDVTYVVEDDKTKGSAKIKQFVPMEIADERI